MKAASYVLFALAGVACAVVAASFLASDVRARLSAWKHGGVVQQESSVSAVGGTDLPPVPAPSVSVMDDVRMSRLENRVEAAEAAAAELSGRVGRLEGRLQVLEAAPVPSIAPAPAAPAAVAVPVAPLLALKLPEAGFTAVDDRNLFGLSLFSGMKFTAYRDRQFEARWYFFDEDYASVKRNLAASSAFKVKETNTFFGKSSFVNLSPSDGFVRVVFDVSGKAAAFEVVQERYEALKKLLLK